MFFDNPLPHVVYTEICGSQGSFLTSCARILIAGSLPLIRLELDAFDVQVELRIGAWLKPALFTLSVHATFLRQNAIAATFSIDELSDQYIEYERVTSVKSEMWRKRIAKRHVRKEMGREQIN